jgi:hypothetical protein
MLASAFCILAKHFYAAILGISSMQYTLLELRLRRAGNISDNGRERNAYLSK